MPETPLPVPTDRPALLAHIEASLARSRTLRATASTSPQRAADRSALRAWQAQRLAATHRNLLESRRYGAAAAFFLADLYGRKDFTERDDEVARLAPRLASVLPIGAVQSLALAIELDALSEDLDSRLIDALRRQGGADAALLLDERRYAAAYRACGNREQRALQIALIDWIGRLLDRVAHKPFVNAALELSRGPARLAGLLALHDFLDRGLHAFRSMNGAQEFLGLIRRRETQIMEQLFAGAAQPFVADTA
ncbi:MAG TPA: hypothetical protein VIA64_18225 [Burkholderiales bacterium]|jgi:hypothetical protein